MSEKKKQDTLTKAIADREDEVAGYEFNIVNYRMLLEDLPSGEMPEHLKSPQSAEEAKEAALYHFRQDVTSRLLAEEIEMDKSRRVLDVLNKRVSLIAQMVLFFFATAIFASCSTAKKAEQPKDKYNYRRAIAPASLAFVSGASWGVNQTLAHHNARFFRAFPKSNERFWGPESWKNKYHQSDPEQGRNDTPIWFTDGQHLTASLNQTLIFGAGICIPIGKKRPLWRYAADIGITSAAYTLGNALTYNVIFHK